MKPAPLLAITLFVTTAHANSPTTAAVAFLATLSGEELQAHQPIDSPARGKARLTPGRRAGLFLNEMDPTTRDSARMLLRQLLSVQGVKLVQAVRDREARLGKIEGNPAYRNPDLYAVAVFGEPTATRWAFRFEGHHLSINLTLEGDRIISVLPFLIGANPREGPPDDLLLPLIRSAQDEAAFALELASLFPPGSGVETAAELKLRLQNLDGFGHPHLTVSRR